MQYCAEGVGKHKEKASFTQTCHKPKGCPLGDRMVGWKRGSKADGKIGASLAYWMMKMMIMIIMIVMMIKPPLNNRKKKTCIC